MAEALQQETLIGTEMAMIIAIGFAWVGREVLEGADALCGEPVECRHRLDGTQDEIAAAARQRERSGLDRLAACGEGDEPRLQVLETDTVAQAEGCPKECMQSGIAARHRRDLGEAGARQARGGERLQRRTVIGAAEPRASECRERGSGSWRVVDGVAGEARLVRRGALLVLIIEMGTIEHRFLPLAHASFCGAH